MFNEAQNLSISGNATNVVHRDQYNGATTIINRIVRTGRPGRTVVERGRRRHDIDSEYDQYREIIRGDIHKLERLSSQDVWVSWEWKDGQPIWTCQRTVHQARVYGDDRAFTAISYHGRDAKKIWKKEFMKYSQADDPVVLLQLFAINRSRVPTLLFYDEWLPLGHLYSKVKETFWEGYYLKVYTCVWWRRLTPKDFGSKLWLNSRTGRISSGPDGPYTYLQHPRVPYNCEDMPSAMEMATTDTCLRFFNQTRAENIDYDVLEYACEQKSFTCIESLLGIDSPDDHPHGFWRRSTCDRRLRLDTVYSGAQLDKIAIVKEGLAYAWNTWQDALSDQTLLDGGLTGFRFNWFNVGSQRLYWIHFDTEVPEDAWLSQVHRSELSISDSETCFIPYLDFCLNLEPRHKQLGVSDSETLPIVYLFLRPPPIYLADIDSWLSQVSFWSFDKNGTSEIPETECECLGLPYITFGEVLLRLYTWPKYIYDGLHAWQVARGFDPATVDFARSLDLPILEPAISQFEEIIEQEPLVCSSPPEPVANSVHRDPDDPSASSQFSPLPTLAATRIPQRQAPRKRKQVQVVIIHDTDSESEPEFSLTFHAEAETRQSCMKSSDTRPESESESEHRSHRF
ncbi:hypothetical protein Moror_1077 [Moniliophthora roreri MCA 2997]|uniref:Uncharacterized protein n=1 Tax=Moniliophthora roreri (strain MCA 2997) TaxID=1381753 RepID=V2XJZ6_MONRO|nr:hypothetical protein Moror_1077 [Moniliophthora roreri MCA 2997]